MIDQMSEPMNDANLANVKSAVVMVATKGVSVSVPIPHQDRAPNSSSPARKTKMIRFVNPRIVEV
jgi:hypothetical protein